MEALKRFFARLRARWMDAYYGTPLFSSEKDEHDPL